MIVQHSLEITAICPVDGKPDIYQCVVSASRVIPVEDILAAAKALSKKRMYQEDICQEMHRQLACRVVLTGYHSGVKTQVSCG